MSLRDLVHEVGVCLPVTTVAQAAEIMEDEGRRMLVVVDLDYRPVGLVTAAQAAKAAGETAIELHAPVKRIMQPVVSIVASKTPHEVALQMQAWSTRRVVVIDEQCTLVGMLHADDVYALVDRDDQEVLALDPR